MKIEYQHPKLGSFVERERNFATYVFARGKWMAKPVELWAMGGANEHCLVRASSIAVLEILMADQSNWTEKVRYELSHRLFPSLRETMQIQSKDFEAFWDSLSLQSIYTDDDLNFEFVFDTTEIGLSHRICVFGAPDLGVEDGFVDPNSPN